MPSEKGSKKEVIGKFKVILDVRGNQKDAIRWAVSISLLAAQDRASFFFYLDKLLE